MFKWLRKFLAKEKSNEESNQFSFPTVNTEPTLEYVSRTTYDALEERVKFLEQNIEISHDSIKLEFPSDVLNSLPLVIKKTIEGIISNYNNDFPEFCFMGMRKALIDGIRICFQKHEEEAKLYNEEGNAYNLPKWIELAKQERYISNNIASNLASRVKVFGDTASHDYMANLQKEEVPAILDCLRIALSRMYYAEETD